MCHVHALLDAQPTSSESEIYEVVKAVLDLSPQILEDLQDYQGANEPIRGVSYLIKRKFTLGCISCEHGLAIRIYNPHGFVFLNHRQYQIHQMKNYKMLPGKQLCLWLDS
jgi:hypothetical protein